MVKSVLHYFYIVKNSLFYFIYFSVKNLEISITKKIMVIIMLDSYIIFERIVICKMLSLTEYYNFTQIIINLFQFDHVPLCSLSVLIF